MARRIKIRKIVLLPLCAILFAVGWASFRAGSQSKPKKKINLNATVKQNIDMKFGVLPPEDLKITAN
jgi:hypothetical protein